MIRRHRESAVALLAALFALPAAWAAGNWTRSAPVLERGTRVMELLAYPEDGKPAAVNPPGFSWTPNEKAKTYRLEVRKSGDSSRTVISAGPLTSTVCPLPHKFEPGAYAWQVVYLDAGGAPVGVSRTRSFQVRAGAPELPMPEVARLRERLAGVRPRLFLSGNRLSEIRDAVSSGKVREWKPFLSAADRALAEPSYPEPAPYANGSFTAAEWRRIYTPGKVGSAHLARTALAYRITGDKKYLDGARRWMMTLAGWDPKGITSHGLPLPDGAEGNDEASMPMIERMSYAWDWLGGEFTPQERAKILAVMTERGNQVLRLLEKQDFLSHPFSNHEGRVLAFLGNAGLSFLGDIPDAEKWLDYVLRCYLTSYPAWGGDEGGWSQGVSYWSAYLYWLTTFAEALRDVTDMDLFRRPFYRNTGYFGVYNHPPYAPRGGFGDGGYHPPSESERMLIEQFAGSYRDPVLKWQAKSITAPPDEAEASQWREWFIEDAVSIWRTPADGTETPAEPPVKLDGSRLFSDIGWAAMHSALGDAKDDVWALFKASRFGSFSHSHADQNTFQLNAYGRALLIDSGYYPWYGSSHDQLWTRQTMAHNGILVNGRGQPPFVWEADGKIESYERQGVVTIVRGQAANAYNRPQKDDVAKLWGELMKEPLPPMEPKVETFERTLAFAGSRTRPVLVVYDFLKADAPATYEWLAHALNRMTTSEEPGSITVQDGDARLKIRLIATEPFAFSQTTVFPVAPEIAQNTAYVASAEERKSKFPDQWHLRAGTKKPAREIKFLAAMVPYRASEPEPEIQVLESAKTRGFRVAGSEVAAWWGDGNRGAISLEGLKGQGRLVVKVTEAGNTQTAVSR